MNISLIVENKGEENKQLKTESVACFIEQKWAYKSHWHVTICTTLQVDHDVNTSWYWYIILLRGWCSCPDQMVNSVLSGDEKMKRSYSNMTAEFILHHCSLQSIFILSGPLIKTHSSSLTGAVTPDSLELLPHAHHFPSPVTCYIMKTISNVLKDILCIKHNMWTGQP